MKEKVSLIIIAMDEEFIHLKNRIEPNYQIINIDNEDVYSFTHNNTSFIAVRGRVGKASTAFYIGRLSLLFDIERIFNLGTSGGYQDYLNVGDVVIADKVCYHDVDATGFNYQYGQVPGFPLMYEADNNYINSKLLHKDYSFKVYRGLISSSDSFITYKNVNNFSIKNINSICCEMEAATVGQCAYLLKIPFVIIRSISDKILLKEGEQSSVINLDLASKNCVDVLFDLI